MSKFLCRECSWVGDEYLKAPNPFDKNDSLAGCPKCLDVNTLVGVCEIENCNKEATCGTPTDKGYVRCCGKHYREVKETNNDN